MQTTTDISKFIKEAASKLGFDACGFCKAQSIGDEQQNFAASWLANGYNADMAYMANNFDKRCDPTILVESARSIVCLALNYFPAEFQREDVPQFAYYAYGKDYHDIVKQKLQTLFDTIKEVVPSLEGRVFCDTAPILERYWASQAGIGFIGKNSLLIIPRKGSFFFLGELIINIELDYDQPLTNHCGNCTRCIDACPTKAIVSPKVINSNRCISYQTIENKGEIDSAIIPLLSNRLYGCDICQKVCPYNHYARPHSTEAFNPSSDFLSLDAEAVANMEVETYQRIFKGSAIKRAKLSGLKRNVEALKHSQGQ
ncbi:tRNA epoxyqueuosine(34) reductase QueG [Dysgonomonas massiliensis]|uniref:tRNA epoxyqueuosine(34) reductase QueG n=1 Tax=Dysgonomonas massiliensis TaxID=2040292 RepID=UPI000C772146|nr:tRNA epoxyqueuosine(34) reductase QueG [Dysgonomonas massiliensis]